MNFNQQASEHQSRVSQTSQSYFHKQLGDARAFESVECYREITARQFKSIPLQLVKTLDLDIPTYNMRNLGSFEKANVGMYVNGFLLRFLIYAVNSS